MSVVFASIDEAAAAHTLPVLLYVRIGGEAVDATEAHVRTSVDRPIGSCTVYVPGPRPATATMNATIEIEMGYPGASARRFYGFIPSDESVTDDRGAMVRIDGIGWASRLDGPEIGGIELAGPVSLKDAFRSLCAGRDIPAYLADETLAIDGVTPIVLGGNTDVDGGNVLLDDRTAPLDWLDTVPRLYGYRVFDCPDGSIRLALVNGLAAPQLSDPVLTTAIVDGDYVTARVDIQFRTAPTTSATSIAVMGTSAVGRVIGDDRPVADGFTWMPLTFPGFGSGWCGIANGSGTPNFYRWTPDRVPPRYEEGVNCFRMGRERDISRMANYIEVLGARYTAGDGGTVAIRAIPDEVPYAAELAPRGWRQETVSSQAIVTDQQAQWVRQATEVAWAAPMEIISWETWGRPDLQPGDVVTVQSETHEITVEDYWLVDLDESVTDRGYLARMRAWRGAGQALRAGNDCVTEVIGTGPYHVGDETLSHYAVPAPSGTSRTIAVTVSSADYSSLRLSGRCHGTNSIGDRTAVTGSVIEVWQLPDPSLPSSGSNEIRKVGSLDLPTADEELSKRRPYGTQSKWWTAFSLPMPGSLKAGPAELRIVAGKPESGGYDDFEVRDLALTYCGVGLPVLPGVGS